MPKKFSKDMEQAEEEAETEGVDPYADSELKALPACRTPGVLAKLDLYFGVHTFEALAILPREGTIGGESWQLTEDKYTNLVQQARDKIGFKTDFKPLGEYHMERKFLSTGSKKFDELIGGGYLLGEITELTGNWGLGKTQSLYTASVTAWEQYKSPCVYVHSEFHQPFSEPRLSEIAKTRGVDYPYQKEFIYCPVFDTYAQEWAALQADLIIKQNKVKLYMEDSILSLYRVEYQGRGELAPRQQAMGAHLKQLARLAAMFKIVVLVTTPAQADPGTGVSQKPAGGAMLHLNLGKIVQFRPANSSGKSGSNYDVKSVNDDGTRELTLVKALDMPVDSRMVKITAKGMDDV